MGKNQMIQLHNSLNEEISYSGSLWSPGVSLMTRLQFGQKALLITFFFIIPIFSLAWFYSNVVLNERRVAVLEKHGAIYVRNIYPIMRAAQEHKALLDLRNIGEEVTRGDIDQAHQSLRRHVEALQVINHQYGEALQTNSIFTELKDAAAQQGGNLTDAPTRAGSAVAAAEKLIEHVSDTSGLELDPEAASFHLVQAAVLEAPGAMIAAAQLRHLGAEMLHQFTPDRMGMLADGSARLGMGHERMGKAFKNSFDADAQLQKITYPENVMQGLSSLKQLVDKQILTASFGDLNAKSFFKEADRKLVDLYALTDRTLNGLDTLLSARVERIDRLIAVTAAVVLLSMVFAAYLFICFYKATKNGMTQIRTHLQALSEGDLRHAPSNPSGRDEPAEALRDLIKTYDSLHSLIRKVRHGARELQTASNEIAAASMDLSARTEASASALEQQSASMDLIGGTVGHTAETAQEAARFASDNASVAERGGQVILEVVATMQDIHHSSSKINDIIGVIDGIAFQTNILALNAAVEAARAGEAGRGFAVVASEVRQLAQRSAGAAREIKSLITASVEKIGTGTTVVQNAGATMTEVVDNAKQINIFLGDISSLANEQATGIAQVAQSIQELDRNTQQNAALVEETTSAASALRNQAELLQREIGNFIVI